MKTLRVTQRLRGWGGSWPGSPRALCVPGGLRRVTIWRRWGFGLPPCSTLRSSQVVMRWGATLGKLQGPKPSLGACSLGVRDPPIGTSANRSLGDPSLVEKMRESPAPRADARGFMPLPRFPGLPAPADRWRREGLGSQSGRRRPLICPRVGTGPASSRPEADAYCSDTGREGPCSCDPAAV